MGELREDFDNIFDRILEAELYPKFLALINTANAKEELKEKGLFTFLAPSNDALDLSSVEKMEEFEDALDNPQKAREILNRYMIKGEYKIHQIVSMGNIKNLNGEDLKVNVKCFITDKYDMDMSYETGIVEIKINDATVQHANIPCSNGIIHFIDRLL